MSALNSKGVCLSAEMNSGFVSAVRAGANGGIWATRI